MDFAASEMGVLLPLTLKARLEKALYYKEQFCIDPREMDWMI